MNAAFAQQFTEAQLRGYQPPNAVTPVPVRSPIDERCVSLAEQSADFNHAVNALEEKLQKVLTPLAGASGISARTSRC